MRRQCEMLRDPLEANMVRCCYLEHSSEEEKKTCKRKHMIYHAEREFGYFK